MTRCLHCLVQRRGCGGAFVERSTEPWLTQSGALLNLYGHPVSCCVILVHEVFMVSSRYKLCLVRKVEPRQWFSSALIKLAV